ncbi:hypothetical protein EDD37DRAFT_649670 [Exophiala viscosa]|uniref:uncharacterized protein n=1 Tax=Exophiala viscosa TaxID=2486360 RepID=UPI0021981650|nr:hypothetical protein EDD37DRAFT_649670 [Exophiala viscosa]
MSETENKENVPAEGAEQAAEGEEQQKQGSSWYSKPEEMGTNAGDKIQGALSPVGKYAGKGFETVGRPVGGLVEPLVGGVMKSGKGWGDQVGVGFGNEGGGPAKQQEEEGRKMKEEIGGKEQNAENPLGL